MRYEVSAVKIAYEARWEGHKGPFRIVHLCILWMQVFNLCGSVQKSC